MKKILGVTAILVAIGMGFSGCNLNVPANGTNTENSGNNTDKPSIPQKELPASVGENPFKGNSYKSGDADYSTEYVFTENEVTSKRNGKIDSVYSYTYNTNTKLLAFKLSKMQSVINPENLLTPEQYLNEGLEVYSTEQKYRTYYEKQTGKTITDEEWKEMVKQIKKSSGLSETAPWSDVYDYAKFMMSVSMPVNTYYSYDFEGSSLKLKDYTNPELTLKQYYTDYKIPYFHKWEESSNTSVNVSRNYVSINSNNGSKSYTITDVTDTVIKVKDTTSKTTLDIPYTMTPGTSPELKITIGGKDYTLPLSVFYITYEKQ